MRDKADELDGLEIADAHNDLLLEVAFRSLQRGEHDAFAGHWLPHLRRGGVGLQVCALYAERSHLPEGAMREVLGQVAAFERAIKESATDVIAVRSQRDLIDLRQEEQVGLMLALEGAEALGYDPWMAEVFWRLGVRMISLTWNRRNPFGDGVGEASDGGLSELGKQLVDLCVDLGLVIDLAHAGEQTFWDIFERTGDGHLIISHAGCRTVFEHPRNLNDAQLQAVAGRGGVLGVMLHPIAVDSTTPTIDRVIDHIDHAVNVMGISHVGLGSDFTRQTIRAIGHIGSRDALLPESMQLDAAIDNLEGPQDYPNLVRALRVRGYEGQRLQAILNKNLMQFLERALPA